MSYPTRAAQLLQPAPVTVCLPELKDGWRYLGNGFPALTLIVPDIKNEQQLFTYYYARCAYAVYAADPSYANYEAFAQRCIVHDLLICGRKFHVDVDNSCCWRRPPSPPGAGWNLCLASCVDKQPRSLLTINDEFEPGIVLLVPSDDPDPFTRYQRILILLYQARGQTQHPGDHSDIDYAIRRYCKLASKCISANSGSMQEALI